MAFYIEIFKMGKEDENFVYYAYQFSGPIREIKANNGKIRYKSEQVSGKLKIDKRSGEVHTIEFAQGDSGNYAKRASWALIKHWKNGEYPDKTCWAS